MYSNFKYHCGTKIMKDAKAWIILQLKCGFKPVCLKIQQMATTPIILTNNFKIYHNSNFGWQTKNKLNC